ncbi:transcriptional regulator [Catellatospora coxensis]
MTTAHPANGLDDVVHQRVRLGIMAITHQARQVEFGFLRETLQLTAGNLGQHLTVLEKAELIRIEKGYEGKRPAPGSPSPPPARPPCAPRSPTSSSSSTRSNRPTQSPPTADRQPGRPSPLPQLLTTRGLRHGPRPRVIKSCAGRGARGGCQGLIDW